MCVHLNLFSSPCKKDQKSCHPNSKESAILYIRAGAEKVLDDTGKSGAKM